MAPPSWADVVTRVVRQASARRSGHAAKWRKLGDVGKIALLQKLHACAAEDVGRVLEDNKADLARFKEGGNGDDEEFLALALNACLDDDERVGPKFETAISFVDSNLSGVKWLDLFDSLLLSAVDRGSSGLVCELLSVAHGGGKNARFPRRPRPNNPALMKACSKNNYGLVRPFLDWGHRIELPPPSSSKISRWRDEIKVVRVFSDSDHPIDNFEGSDDHIRNLQLLKLHAQPAYLLACYASIADKYDWEGAKTRTCECEREGDESSPTSSSKLLKLQYRLPKGERAVHHCPYHEEFVPSLLCGRHMECNDPISRCFVLAKLCSDYSSSHPDRRQNYDEVAKSCESLAVELLEKCSSLDEVKLVLREKSSASRFFSETKFMTYPRLRLAVEHNRKYFAGHIYCQQVIRDSFYGSSGWSNKSFAYKLVYFLLQTLLTPLHGLVYQTFFMARQFPESFDYSFVRYASRHRVNLDLPVNRFISYTGWHLIYVGLVVLTAFPSVDGAVYARTEFAVIDYVLTVFSASMFIRDLLNLIVVKSFRVFAKFWRLYMLLAHLLLSSSLIMRIVVHTYDCEEDVDPEAKFDYETKICRDLLLTACYFHSMSAIMAVCSLLFWLQFHHKIGPVAINISRVTLDLFTMAAIYVLITFGFSLGLTLSNSSRLFIRRNETSSYNATMIIMKDMFWSTLSPGPPETVNIDSTGWSAVTTVIFVIYQISTVIIFLNLLIAVMNTTINKLEDRKVLYWQFTKATMQVGFFEETSAIPSPWNLMAIDVWPFYVAGSILGLPNLYSRCGSWVCGKDSKRDGGDPASLQHSSMDEATARERERYCKLLLTLIERHEDESEKKAAEEEAERTKLKALKEELLRDIKDALVKERQLFSSLVSPRSEDTKM